MDKVKVVHLTSVHPAFDTRIFHKECKSLVESGYDVSLVVPHKADELVDGVKILAVSPGKNRLSRIFLTSWKVFFRGLKEKASIYHFHDPELIPAGILLRLLGAKVIYDVHEDLPRQLLVKSWLNPLIRLPLSYLASVVEWVSSRLFLSSVVVVTNKIKDRFPSNKTILVQNYSISGELFTNEEKIKKQDNTFCFVGSLKKNYGIEEIITAISEVEGAKLILGGSFPSRAFENKIRSLDGWKSVEYVGWLDRTELAKVLAKSICGFIVYHPEPNIISGQPNKLFEYMSAGIPVISSDFPLWRSIVEKNNCGLLVNPLSNDDIKKAIEKIINYADIRKEMGVNGRAAVLKHYDWGNESKNLIGLYSSLLEKKL